MDNTEDPQSDYKHERPELSPHLKVLHVDDDPSILEVSRNILEIHGPFEVDTASSVDEAINKIGKCSYNVIVSDYEMPGKDGLIFLQKLNEKRVQLPFIIFTGKGREEVAIKALNLGAFRYINKHGDPETVYTELATSIRQAAQQANSQLLLKESEERYHGLFSTMKDGIALHEMLYDAQGNAVDYVILDVNPAYEAILGIKKEDAVGKKSTELYGVSAPPYIDIYAKTAAIGEHISFESFFAPIQKYFYIHVFSPAKNKFATMFVDITQIKESEKALRDSLNALSENKEHWATTLSSIGDAVITTDVAGKITFMNNVAETLTGWALTEAEQKPLNEVFKIINEYSRNEIENPVIKVLKKGTIIGLANHTVLISKNGIEIPIDDSGAPIMDKEGRITGVVLVFRDITERKKSEEVLRQSEEKFEKAFRSSPVALCINRFSDGCFIDVNESYLRLFEYNREEVISHDLTEINVFADSHERKMLEYHLTEHKSLYNFETTGVTKTGKHVRVIVSFEIVRLGKQNHILSTMVDVTKRKKVEDNLRESEEKFRSLAEESPNMIFINKKGQVVYANKKCEELMGYKREEFYSPSFNFLSLIAPESIELLKSAFVKHTKGEEIAPYEYKLITKYGRKIEAEINSKLIPYEGENAILGVITDITERKKAKEAAEKQLKDIEMMNEKLRVIGGLTRHDVRNKLSIIVGNAFLLKKSQSNQPDVIEAVSKIETVVKEIDKIFEFSRMYEQIGIEELTMIDASKAFDEATAQFPELNIKMKNKCTELTVLADSFLKRLFFSLIDNTAKHGKKATSIDVYCNKTDENKLELVFEDNGVGIIVENKNLLYKPGFSTANSTGYGLYLIKRIIDIYGWNIQEKGEPGKGTKFIITIPKTNREGKTNYIIKSS